MLPLELDAEELDMAVLDAVVLDAVVLDVLTDAVAMPPMPPPPVDAASVLLDALPELIPEPCAVDPTLAVDT